MRTATRQQVTDMHGAPGPTFGRRSLLAGAAAIAGLIGREAGAAQAKAPLRQELTVGFAAAHTDVRPVARLSTFEIAVELESPTEAVRIGVANVVPSPHTLLGAAFAEASIGQPLRPLPGSEWHYIGFGGAGTPPRGPQPVTVPGNRVASTGATNVPAVLWSDWVPYRSTPGARAMLLFRILVPPQQLALTMVGWPESTQKAEPRFPPLIRVGRDLPGDFVTNPQLPPPFGTKADFVPMFAVQYRSATPGIQIVLGGDSHPAVWDSVPQLTAMELSTPARPIAVWNVAWGSMQSKTFWPILEMAIEQARPSICVIEGWSANDGGTPEIWDRYLPLVQQNIEHTRRLGGIPIVVTGWPRKMFGTPRVEEWRRYNRDLPRRFPGVLIFDADPIVEDPDHPGDWRPEFTNDRYHPNPAANAAMVPTFERILKPLL